MPKSRIGISIDVIGTVVNGGEPGPVIRLYLKSVFGAGRIQELIYNIQSEALNSLKPFDHCL